ncbi:glycosyltransferase [Enterococcus sp. LJL98]
MATYLLHFNNTIEAGYPYWNYGAVGKWRKDFEDFATEIGVERIRAYTYHWPDEPNEVLSARLDGILGGLKKNDLVIVHWAFGINSERWITQFAQRVKLFRAHLVFMISDIESWRMDESMTPMEEKNPISERQRREVSLLSLADGFLLHSKEMEEQLRNQFERAGKNFQASVSYIGPYGYKTTYYGEKRTFSKSIDYAGSLEKAKFLLELPEGFKLTVFGAKPDEQDRLAMKENIIVHKRIDPEGIPFVLHSAFGLVWDSDSYPTVTGPFGNYQRSNTPGKLPLYLAANQPVIVWSQSPLAKFVKRNKLGLVVDDLEQLPEKLNQLTEKAYNEMIENVQKISPLIRNGTYIKKAILEIELLLLTHS